jgi:Domain of unknown function (DUF5665)
VGKTKSRTKTSYNSRDYEQLGRLLVNVYETGFSSHKRLYVISFLKGVFLGLGGAIGASIVVGVIVWCLSVLERIPVVGPLFNEPKQTLEQKD